MGGVLWHSAWSTTSYFFFFFRADEFFLDLLAAAFLFAAMSPSFTVVLMSGRPKHDWSIQARDTPARAVLRQFDPELLESFAAPSMKKASQGSNRFPYTVRSRRSAGNAQTPRGRPSYWGRMIMPISS